MSFQWSKLSFSSIVNCDPSYPTQTACLLIAGLLMDTVAIPGIQKATSFVLKNLVPQRARDQIFGESQDSCKGVLDSMNESEFLTTFNEEFKKRGVDMDVKAEFEKLGDKGDWSKKVDAFYEEKKDVLLPLILDQQAYFMALGIQHGVAGTFGLLALMAGDKTSFLRLARWGVMAEAGWELFDLVKEILYPVIVKGKALDLSKIPNILHHICLYFCFPINRTLLPSDYIGRDVAWAAVLYAGLGGPMAILNFAKSIADVSTFSGLFTFTACHFTSTVPFVFARGIHWPYFAYKLLKYEWGDSWLLYITVCALVLLFSLFNLLMLTFVAKGFKKFLKIFKKSYAALKGETDGVEEEEEFVPKQAAKRESRIVDVMIQDFSISAGNGTGSARRVSIMGIDYELDDDEMKQANVRLSKIVTSSRPSVFAAFAALSEDDLADVVNEDTALLK